MSHSSSKSIRKLVLEQLSGNNAHIDFTQAVSELTYKQAALSVDQLPHTIWDLIEHIRITEQDILEFCKNPDYKDMDWPDDYWPESSAPDSQEKFEQSIQAVQEGIKEMRKIVRNPENDLLEPLEHGSGQTLFREAMLIVNHNAYHIAQIVQVRRLLGNW